jgi:hypothetical protein
MDKQRYYKKGKNLHKAYNDTDTGMNAGHCYYRNQYAKDDSRHFALIENKWESGNNKYTHDVLIAKGYKLVYMTKAQKDKFLGVTFEQLKEAYKGKQETKAEREKRWQKEHSKIAISQIKKCLKSEPLNIVKLREGSKTNVVDLKNTFASIYDGDYECTAYIYDNKLVAWHYHYYGYDMNVKAIKNCKKVLANVCSSKILFEYFE